VNKKARKLVSPALSLFTEFDILYNCLKTGYYVLKNKNGLDQATPARFLELGFK
jgi:hypothetical protein